MSRRNRPIRSAVAATSAPPAPRAAAGFGSGDNGHDAVDFSRLRGYIYFPQLDTKKEITPFTRREVMRKARWFCVNHGLPRRIVFGLSRLAAGTGMTPHPMTADKEWNRAALDYFAMRADSPFVFDVGGRFDFYGSQAFALAAHYRDGDISIVQTESQTKQARFALYEGHQMGNAGELAPGMDQLQWYDGVRLDANNAALAYRYLNDDGTFTDVPSSNVIFLGNYERAGQSRCTSILEHAVNHLHDATDILSFIKTGVKLSNLYGYWFERQNVTAPTGPASIYNQGPVSNVDLGNGNKLTLEQIIGGGAIPQLDPGVSLKFNSTSHPHPNNLNLIDYLVRDVAWGVGVAPDLLWNIAALGGANTRFVLADAQSWIEAEQEKLIRLYCQRVWLYTIAKGMKAKQLRPCRDPQWWKVGWIPPPRITVDFGRDGRLYIEQQKSAMLTLKTAYGWSGQDWQPHVDQWLDEIAYIKAGLNKENASARSDENRNLTWDDIQQFRATKGSRPVDTNSSTTSGDDGLPTEPGQASAALAELAKNPAAAQAFLKQLSAQPIAA